MQLSLRAIFVMVFFMALAAGLVSIYLQAERNERRIREQIDHTTAELDPWGLRLKFDGQGGQRKNVIEINVVNSPSKIAQANSKKLQPFQGLDNLKVLTFLGGQTDEDLALFSACHKIEVLQALNPEFTDAGLRHVANRTNLKRLYLVNAKSIGDTGVAQLRDLTNLEYLWCSGSQITDEGLQTISTLSKLRELNLSYTAVTNQGVQCLGLLQDLRDLNLTGSGVRQEGYQFLKAALPDCTFN